MFNLQQAENFCNSIGVLQQFSQPSFFPEFDKSSKTGTTQQGNQMQGNEDFAQLFASLIAKTAKEIDLLIESLPSEDSTPELQVRIAASKHNSGQSSQLFS